MANFGLCGSVLALTVPVLSGLVDVSQVRAQSAENPRFEVASVKLHAGVVDRNTLMPPTVLPGGRFVSRFPLAILISASAVAFFGTGFFAGSGIMGSELFPTPIRATALGISYNAARGLSAFAPLLIGRIGETHGLSWAFGLCGIAFGLAAISALALPETRGLELT